MLALMVVLSVRDVFDNFAKMFGYVLWDWGIAAEWVGAIGTAGAFIFAFYLMQRDRRAKQTALADGVSFWVKYLVIPGSGSLKPNRRVIFLTHNGSFKPLPMAWIVVRTMDYYGKFEYVFRPAYGKRDSNTIKSDEIVEVSWHIGTDEAIKGDVFLYFTDGEGKAWVRSLRTKKLLSRRGANRIVRSEKQFPAEYS